MLYPELVHLGWTDQLENSLIEAQRTLQGKPAQLMRVVAFHRQLCELRGADIADRVHRAIFGGDDAIAIGDWVYYCAEEPRSSVVLERHTQLVRKASGHAVDIQIIATNVDTLLIVTSCTQEFNQARLERYLALALNAGVVPVVVLTKPDLTNNLDHYRRQANELYGELNLVVVDARNTSARDALSPWLTAGNTLAMVGSSGVGKSSLATSLGAEQQLAGEVRDADQKGRHTTTWRSLQPLPSGAVLIDNPGIRELQLTESADGINELFADVLQFDHCKFNDCSHQKEPGCGIRAAIKSGQLDQNRFFRYQKLLAEAQENCETLAQKRARERKTGKLYKQIQTENRRVSRHAYKKKWRQDH